MNGRKVWWRVERDFRRHQQSSATSTRVSCRSRAQNPVCLGLRGEVDPDGSQLDIRWAVTQKEKVG